jgi:hypothetical protein
MFNFPKKKKDKSIIVLQMCFNCNSTEHPARDCPHPRDHRRISQNRNSFNSRRESGNSVRLHENQNSGNGKEGMMLPGKISQELRQALGIGDQDLPEWIYRMRAIGPAAGYPPAYRKKCLLNSTDEMKISLFCTLSEPRK